MLKNVEIRVRIDASIKEQAEAVLQSSGTTPEEAINMFYKELIHQNGLPFKLAAPKQGTCRAIAEARAKDRLIAADSLADLFLRLDD